MNIEDTEKRITELEYKISACFSEIERHGNIREKCKISDELKLFYELKQAYHELNLWKKYPINE